MRQVSVNDWVRFMPDPAVKLTTRLTLGRAYRVSAALYSLDGLHGKIRVVCPGKAVMHDAALFQPVEWPSPRTGSLDGDPTLGGRSVETPAVSAVPEPIVQKFASGAVRGTDANGTRYDLISPHILTALAETYAEGSGKYGDTNWLKGLPSKDLINHALRHIVLWQQGDTSEPHLAHALWNLGAIIHFEKTRPDLIDRQYAQPPEYWIEKTGS